jgi:hypothetical protein
MTTIKFSREETYFDRLTNYQANPQPWMVAKQFLTPKMLEIFASGGDGEGTETSFVAAFQQEGLLEQWEQLIDRFSGEDPIYRNLLGDVEEEQDTEFSFLAEHLSKKYPDGYTLSRKDTSESVYDNSGETLKNAFFRFIREFESFEYSEQDSSVFLNNSLLVEIEAVVDKPDMTEIFDELFGEYPDGFTLTYGEKSVNCYEPDPEVTDCGEWLEKMLVKVHGPYLTLDFTDGAYFTIDGEHIVDVKKL